MLPQLRDGCAVVRSVCCQGMLGPDWACGFLAAENYDRCTRSYAPDMLVSGEACVDGGAVFCV